MRMLPDRAALVNALKLAIDLEVSVMLQYLYAAYSLPNFKSGEEYVRRGLWSADELHKVCGDGAETRDYGWRGVILDVAHEEMIHFVVANNLLRALGEPFHPGSPRFGCEAHELGGIELSLEAFGASALARFIALEEPMGSDGVALGDDGDRPRSISALYASIREAFVRMPEVIVAKKGGMGGEHHLFLNQGVNRRHPDYQLQVDDLPSALFGIDFVVAQGEGGPSAPSDAGPAHLERFQRIAQEYRDIRQRRGDIFWTPAYPALKNPTLQADRQVGCRIDDPTARAVASLANECHHLMLQLMSEHFMQPTSSMRRSRLMNASIDIMTGLLRPLGIALMGMPSGVPGFTAGPSFEWGASVAGGSSLPDFCRGMAERCDRLARMAEGLQPVVRPAQVGMLARYARYFTDYAEGRLPAEA